MRVAEADELTPQEWCRRVLDAQSHRRVQARKVQELELLLQYFIELDPTPEEFADLLAERTGDTRQSLAEVAQELEQAWLRVHIGRVSMATPPLQETLRTLGAMLDEYDAQAGFLTIVGGSTQLQPFGEWKPRALDAVELLYEIAARTALRGQHRRADPTDPHRFETRLRAVGADLDAQPKQAYQFLVSRQTIVVEGSAGCYRFCTSEGLAPQLRTLATLRKSSGEEQPSPA